jgi:hypothetical protein
MRRLVNIAVAVTMASLFSVMFWSQLGAVASAVARPKAPPFAIESAAYLPLQMLEPVY